MKYWFTGDTHFKHINIIKYAERPFSSIEEMDNTLIKNWNKKVHINDIVFHLGDFGFLKSKKEYDEITKQLNGTIIQLHGNHDNKINSIIREIIIKHGGRNIFMSHIPETCIDSGMDICFCAHVHNTWKHRQYFKKTSRETIIINVGVDVWNYEPINIEDIINYLSEEGLIWK